MKPKEHTRQVRDKVVEKFKAWLGYEKISQTLNISWSTASPENGKSIAPLQTYQDMVFHLNWQAGQGEHWSEKQPRGPW